MEPEKENILIKKMESIETPDIETPGHKTRLKAALLDSPYFQKRRSIFLFEKIAIFGASAVFLLTVFYGSDALFFKKSDQGVNVNMDNKDKQQIATSYSVDPKQIAKNDAPGLDSNLDSKNTPVPNQESDVVSGDSAGWNTYEGKNYEITLPESWKLESVAVQKVTPESDSNNSSSSDGSIIAPSPVHYENQVAEQANSLWLAKDSSGSVKLEIKVEPKTEQSIVSLEEFANKYSGINNAKNAASGVFLEKINLGINEVIRQRSQNTAEQNSNILYYTSDSKFFYIIQTEGNVDAGLAEQIISTMQFNR